MPNKSKINRELVKAFNSVLLSDNTAITNLTIEKDHVVLSFDKDMNIGQCKDYLKNMKESIVGKFCGDNEDEDEKVFVEKAANDLFYTDSFPFNFNQGKWTTDSSKHRFSVPIEKGVVCNLKYLLANELIRFTIESIIDDHPKGPDYVNENVYDVSFERKSYLYCKGFDDQELKDSFVKLFSSRMESYENSPKRFKGFLEDKGHYVYLKKGVFDDLKFVQDIVKHRASLICRCFDAPKGEIGVSDMLKFAVVDLFRKANISVVETERASYSDSDEDSVLIPIVSGNNDDRYLTKEEAEHVNNIFGMVILNNVEGHTSQESLLNSDSKGLYGIDFANPDIAYCVMDKIIESSVINEDYKLSIDPARVPAMKPQTLAPPEKVGIDGPSADSGFGGSPKNSVIGKSHTGNSSKFLRTDYCGEDKGGDGASGKDSGFGASSARSSARSFFNNPKTTFDQPSVSQSDQCSAKKRTSISKKSSCCIS
ncbi:MULTISPECIES: hypothetical protein [Wolbachia]|uniref:hypothetical protein n=1 Tax=Wolbachia TaxID=953 RepID=UPI0002403EC9|nr:MULTISPECIES: hypothetical protein [Wolbachia]UYC23460.1 hypothetical protein L3551_06185 [Wolbachia endosymbiont of Aedes aegypti]QBB83725.1 hypothetical protein DEJ70_02650 [Wolbachia pipientis wAlbB]QDW08531.1 hypothetical protein CO539_002640 [Wolbachia pipientis]QDW09721.1 hypothetical protein CO538_002640 [Wolbachia pipientis]QZA83919.1 hypothetical protein K1Y75_02580 [Wolbachia pipientis]